MSQAPPVSTNAESYVRAAAVTEIESNGCRVVQIQGHSLALFRVGEQIYAIDNRCPHMGFPLHRGTVKQGMITCHWHYARFDLASGGTFDAWADDVRVFPVQIREGEVWVSLAPQSDLHTHQRQRLQDGLAHSISLVIAKSVIAWLESGADPRQPFRTGLEFGTRYRQAGWGTGLTIHTCMINLLPYLDRDDRPLALFHGLSAIARDCAGSPPRFGVQPLPNAGANLETLASWFRQFIEVRDAEAAERCLISAIQANATPPQLTEMLLTAATDHRYSDGGHRLDFINKALEALDATDWQDAESVLTSLVTGLAQSSRMEEANAWRYPVDLVALLESAFATLPSALATGQARRGTWNGRTPLIAILLGEDAAAIVEALLNALQDGCTETELAATVAYAAALRIAHFHTNNDLGDWDTAHHTFTFANAVHQGLQRVPSPELLRGVFDAAMSVYLNRFLNVPPARLPEPEDRVENPDTLLQELSALLDRQQQVNPVGQLVVRYFYSGGKPERLLAMLGKLLLRENRDFHTIEAAFRQYMVLWDTRTGVPILVAAARYLAAHAPTPRSQRQTYQIAYRLHRGDRVFEET